MSETGGFRAVLVLLLMVGGVLAASGCLDGEDDDDDKVTIPDDRKYAKLTVGGTGIAINEPPKEHTIQDIVDMGLVDFEATFVNSVGTTYTANYTGVPLNDLLDTARPTDRADIVEVEATDGYVARLFYADIDETTYLALKEDGKWNDLSEAGAFRLVDTDLPSVYWVRQISEIRLVGSDPLALWTDNFHWEFITAGWIREHSAVEVSWTEGEKTRTYMGAPLSDVVEEAGLNTSIDNYVSLVSGDDYTILPSANATVYGVLVVDSRGVYVYVQEDEGIVVKGLSKLSIASGFHLGGAVGSPYDAEWEWLGERTPNEVVEFNENMYWGPLLSWLVAESAPDAGADAVKVTAGDGYSAVFPIATLGIAILAIQENGGPFEGDIGQLRVIDVNRSGNFHVGWVVELDVFISEPIVASGSVNVTDILDIGHMASNADTNISYNDGRRDRTYPGMTWDAVVAALDADTTASKITLVDADEESVEWDIADLLGRTDSGICVDSRGNYVAYDAGADDAFFDLASIDIS